MGRFSRLPPSLDTCLTFRPSRGQLSTIKLSGRFFCPSDISQALNDLPPFTQAPEWRQNELGYDFISKPLEENNTVGERNIMGDDTWTGIFLLLSLITTVLKNSLKLLCKAISISGRSEYVYSDNAYHVYEYSQCGHSALVFFTLQLKWVSEKNLEALR